MKLQVLICTLGHEGLLRVARMQLPKLDVVGYLISCQADCEAIPESLQRDDVKVHFTDSRGLSNNRNNALSLASAEYVLIADDDLTFYADGLQRIITCFDDHPDIDIATFKVDGLDKVYPTSVVDIFGRNKGYNISSVEIALRLSSIKKSGVAFDPRFGLGSNHFFTSGEEEIFLLDLKDAGAKGRFFPIVIATHPEPSTGMRMPTPGTLHASGAIIRRRYPFTAIVRIPLKAFRAPTPFFPTLLHLLRGALKATR